MKFRITNVFNIWFSFILCTTGSLSIGTNLLNAKSYYIDNGLDASGDGASWRTAWNSFANINWNIVSPGDTIYISGGTTSKTYAETLTIGKSGAAEKHIVISKGSEAQHNGTVLIDGEYERYGVRSEGFSYVTIQNIHFDRNSHSLRIRNGTHFVVQGLRINARMGRGIHWENISNGLISNCHITTDIGAFDYQTDGVYLQFGNNNRVDKCRIVISNNHPNPHSDGIQLYKETNPTISNNYIEQNVTNALDNNGIWSETCSGTYTVFNNVIYTPYAEPYFNTFGYLERGANVSLRIYNNTFVGGNSPNVLTIDDSDAIIKNNIFVGTYSGIGVILSNNLNDNSNLNYNLYGFLNSAGAIVRFGSGGNKTIRQLQTLGAEIHGLDRINPLFVDIAKRDFSLQSGSPAIDAGVSMGSEFGVDQNGVLRPQRNGWDMGAFEYMSTDSILPLPPRALRVELRP